ncbi:MAG: MBL fold metallo-hydrolase [Anaerolineae bacterium]|nr:MBL fold metallo-hydrolase [Anaerolineae bacterium]
MRRERVSDDIYVFTSSLYAQVTASAVVTREGVVVVDTLPYPVETFEMIECLNSLGQGPIKYLVNTHWHGDHTYGNYLFDDSTQLVCHKKCQQLMQERGPAILDEARETTPFLEEVQLRVPDIVFEEGELVLHVGNKSIEVTLTPGHTLDSTVAYVREDKVLLAADTVMPVPYFVWGDRYAFRESLKFLKGYNLESIVQGHGEVLLRGEIPMAIESSIRYLDMLQEKVQMIIDRKLPRSALDKITIESCGKSRIPLNGLVQDLHRANVYMLYDELTGNSA